jgi:hypothetical protein
VSRFGTLVSLTFGKDLTRMIPSAEILSKYGVNATWPATAIRVAVIARLPRSEDRKLFDALAEKCMTHVELIDLAATTLGAFERRQTPLRPPPSGEERPDLRCK